MAAPDMKIAGLQNVFLPALLQSLLSEICSRVVQALAHSSCVLEDSSSNSMTSCVHHPAETRPGDISSKLTEECTARRLASNFDEENDSSEKCRVSILDKVATPDRADKAPRQQFSEWLLVAKNKDDEDEDDDEDDDDDDEDDDDEDEDEDDEGDDEEGDDEVGGHAEGEKGDGDKDEEEDEADDDDEDEDEDEEEEDEDDDEDEEDESPPKKLRK